MGRQPIKSGKRIINRKITATNSLAKLDRKTRREIAGTFQEQARRESMDGSEANRPESKTRFVRDGGRVVNFGGEVTVVGRFAREEKAELLNEVDNLSKAKSKKDPSDSVLQIKTNRDGFIVYTSKTNLAVAIGKHLHRSRKGGELTIVWTHYDSPVRVIWRAAQ